MTEALTFKNESGKHEAPSTSSHSNDPVVVQIESQQPDFITLLVKNSPADLWFELRCLHPVSGKVRTLWSQSGNDNWLRNNLKQAERMNRQEGYSVFFAPCLRNEKKGTADFAASMPALWVDLDCENDPHQRSVALKKLHDFDHPPSFIVDSGGGWHAYWLLDKPFIMSTDADREKAAALLRGLFKALGADEAYAKSAASLMRLPGSLNTKPARKNALVKILESHPDRQYTLADLAWLEAPKLPEFSRMSGMRVVSSGEPRLSRNTRNYITYGVSKNRNNTLLKAASQMRDAGMSQAEAERLLIPRYVADVNPEKPQSPAARERRARRTIASAYSYPRRASITEINLARAQASVGKLVDRYGQKQTETQRPSSQEIVEAVEACIHLNAVEWAEQREALKHLTGDGLKISDIDRLYREKKKAHEKQLRQEYVDSESYLLLDGKMVYRKAGYRGTKDRTVADWAATALHQTCQVDDDGRETHVTVIELQRGSAVKKLEVPGEVFVDDLALRRFLGVNAGAQYVVRAGMSKHLVPAIVHLSGEFPTHRHYNFMGWKQMDGRWVYLSPGDCITSNGRLAEPPSVELEQRLHDYGLQGVKWQASLQAFDAVVKVLPPNLAPSLIAFALLPIIQRFFPPSATRPAIHLVGTSGSGKSEIASLLSSFYGQFSRDTPPAQWGDTINTVEMLGYPLADALYWVDDYKDIYADTRTFVRFLQSYSRNLGRGRLTREAKLQTSRPCRGLILSTGETRLEGEMSVSSRMMSLEIPPWKHRDPQGAALAEAEVLRDKLPGFTAHFASWVARQLGTGDFEAQIASRFSQNLIGYTTRIAAQLGRSDAHDRAVKNWAVLVTVFQIVSKFVAEMDDDYLLPAWQDCILETVRNLRRELASQIFLDILGQLLAGGQVVIDDDMRNPREYPPGVTLVGYQDGSFIYLLPEIALKAVNHVQPINFGANAIGNMLQEDGFLLPGSNNLSTQKRVRGGRVRLWQLKKDALLEPDEA